MSGFRVLMYHKISESETDFLTVTTAQLTQQLGWIKKHFTVVSLKDVIQYIKTGTILPDNALLITFDDGYRNNYTLAYPIFKQFELPFSIFLVNSFIGKTLKHDHQLQEFLNPSELIEMQDFVQYGYHSTNHLNLMDIAPHLWKDEISSCIAEFNQLGIHLQPAWAYTYGGFPKKNKLDFDNLKKIFHSQGITCAFRIGNRINSKKLKEPYAIERIDVRGNETFLKLKLKVRFGKVF